LSSNCGRIRGIESFFWRVHLFTQTMEQNLSIQKKLGLKFLTGKKLVHNQ
jgi:hypothetical protein